MLDESERASEKQTYMTDTRCKAKKLDKEKKRSAPTAVAYKSGANPMMSRYT